MLATCGDGYRQNDTVTGSLAGSVAEPGGGQVMRKDGRWREVQDEGATMKSQGEAIKVLKWERSVPADGCDPLRLRAGLSEVLFE
jgi:hypothetical protein